MLHENSLVRLSKGIKHQRIHKYFSSETVTCTASALSNVVNTHTYSDKKFNCCRENVKFQKAAMHQIKSPHKQFWI